MSLIRSLNTTMPPPAPRSSGSGYVAAIGDSLTAWNGDGTSLRQRETWFQILCARSGQRIRYGGVFATGGYTMVQIRDTHLPSVLAMNPLPTACFVFGGTNTGAGANAVQNFSALQDICRALEGQAIAPVLVALLPRADGGDASNQQWNLALRQYAARKGYLMFSPGDGLLTAAGVRDSALAFDTVHPTAPAGHVAMANRALVEGLHMEFPPASRVTAKASGDGQNLIPSGYGLFAVDTNADGLADGWAASGTNVTYTLVTPDPGDDLVGNWQRVSRTPGGATSTVFQRTVSTGYSVGDRLAYSGRFRSAVEGTGANFTFQCAWNGVAVHNLEALFNWETNYADGTFYGEAIVPSGVTGIQVQTAISIPTSGTAQVDAGELTLWNLTTAEQILPA